MRVRRSGTPRVSAVRLAATAALPLALLSACGGGGSDTSTAAHITSVKVAGDSLADSGGTYGYKFTVQKTTSSGAIDITTPRVYPELVAQSYGIASLCSYYQATSATTFVASSATGCTNYAVGGGRINYPAGPTSAISIPVQLAKAGAAGYTATDMVIIDGGGNDAADVISAYLAITTDSGASYGALLSSLLPAATVTAGLQSQNTTTIAQLGGAYMVALADSFYATINTNVLSKGATHVVVLNMPGITATPEFQLVLQSISTAYGGGAAGAAAQANATTLFTQWITAFNTELATKFSGESRVVLVDFFSNFNAQVASPAQYGLTNATTPACPATGADATTHLPTYTFQTCTDVDLTAMTPPTGATGGSAWWQTYGFSDSFHPTPQGHKNLAQLISRSLSQAGWL